jgi:hypothetical protein
MGSEILRFEGSEAGIGHPGRAGVNGKTEKERLGSESLFASGRLRCRQPDYAVKPFRYIVTTTAPPSPMLCCSATFAP